MSPGLAYDPRGGLKYYNAAELEGEARSHGDSNEARRLSHQIEVERGAAPAAEFRG